MQSQGKGICKFCDPDRQEKCLSGNAVIHDGSRLMNFALCTTDHFTECCPIVDVGNTVIEIEQFMILVVDYWIRGTQEM